MDEYWWMIGDDPIALRKRGGRIEVAVSLKDPLRPEDEAFHDFGGAHTLEEDFAEEILRLAQRVKELESAVEISQGRVHLADDRLAAMEEENKALRKKLLGARKETL